MASFLSLPTELQLNIIEQLDLTSASFIPAPSQDLLSLSRVCKVLRTLVLPSLLNTITLLNEENHGSSVLTVVNSAHAQYVRHVHYIGIMEIPDGMDTGEDSLVEPPAPDHLPDSVETVLSNLDKLPKLERVVVEFRCAKIAEDNEDIHQNSFYHFDQLEEDRLVLQSEKTVAYRSLMERSYRALARNTASTIKNIEFKNVVAKRCSAWNLSEFQALLGGLTSFTISLRGGDNGAGWQINMLEGYLDFVSHLDAYLFEHLSHTEHFSFAATGDGPPGIEGGLNNTALPLFGQHMPRLKSLSMEHVFISKNLAAFITAHGETLESVRLADCYSGWDNEDEITWGKFFLRIASVDMKSLCLFDIAPTDFERLQHTGKDDYYYHRTMRAQELREQFPERRMLDYKFLDNKYGMVFDNEDQVFERFETGTDHTGWEQLWKVIKKNMGGDR
jgi:hypothetical protein